MAQIQILHLLRTSLAYLDTCVDNSPRCQEIFGHSLSSMFVDCAICSTTVASLVALFDYVYENRTLIDCLHAEVDVLSLCFCSEFQRQDRVTYVKPGRVVVNAFN